MPACNRPGSIWTVAGPMKGIWSSLTAAPKNPGRKNALSWKSVFRHIPLRCGGCNNVGIPKKTIETITADEYLSLERQAEERNEFYQGECMAMAGGSRWHNRLAGQIFAALVHHLDGKPCTPYMADIRLSPIFHYVGGIIQGHSIHAIARVLPRYS